MLTRSNFSQKWTKITGILHEDLRTFITTSVKMITIVTWATSYQCCYNGYICYQV